MSENTRLKDIYFTDSFVRSVAGDIAAVYPDFDRDGFIASVHGGGFKKMALKQKMRHMTHCLKAYLPRSYGDALAVLLAVAPAYDDFDGMVFSDYVGCYGLDDWDLSLPALRELTRTMSAEFAIRPFLSHDPQRALPTLYEWAGDPDPSVRRLASEGCRPRLPWGMALAAFKSDPTPILPILDKLKNDPSEDVRRSVANNLNDIAKDNPLVVLDLAESWFGQNEALDQLVKHACRTLLKRGDVRAMRLFGFADPAEVQVSELRFDPPELAIGDELVLTYFLDVQTAEPMLLRLEYAITFARANGKSSRKVFHHRETVFNPGLQVIIRKHGFRDLSTRKHFPGRQGVEIIVNGVVKGRGSIELTA